MKLLPSPSLTDIDSDLASVGSESAPSRDEEGGGLDPMAADGQVGEPLRHEGAVEDQGGAAGSGGTAAAPTLTWVGSALMLNGRLCANVLYLPRSRWRVSLYREDLVLNCRVLACRYEHGVAIAEAYALHGALP